MTQPPEPTAPTPPTPEEEAAYGKFKSWLDRYSEENKPAPEKTNKPGNGSFFESLFGGTGK